MSDPATLEALLRAEDRKEDWLVYADWLTDQGDVRGKLIVLEQRVKAAPPGMLGLATLRQEIAALRAAHENEWLSGLALPKGFEIQWRHGFVVGLVCRGSHDMIALLSRALDKPNARFLSALRMPAVRLDDKTTAAFLSRYGHRFVSLDISCNANLGKKTLDGLLSADLSLLRDLNLGGIPIGDDGIELIVASGALRSLRKLSLAGVDSDIRGAELIAASPSLRSLSALDLGSNHIGDIGAAAIARSLNLGTLRWLSLVEAHIGDDGAAALSSSVSLGMLEELYLSSNRIALDAAIDLARSSSLRALRILDLKYNLLGNQGELLAAEEPLPSGRKVRW